MEFQETRSLSWGYCSILGFHTWNIGLLFSFYSGLDEKLNFFTNYLLVIVFSEFGLLPVCFTDNIFCEQAWPSWNDVDEFHIELSGFSVLRLGCELPKNANKLWENCLTLCIFDMNCTVSTQTLAGFTPAQSPLVGPGGKPRFHPSRAVFVPSRDLLLPLHAAISEFCTTGCRQENTEKIYPYKSESKTSSIWTNCHTNCNYFIHDVYEKVCLDRILVAYAVVA